MEEFWKSSVIVPFRNCDERLPARGAYVHPLQLCGEDRPAQAQTGDSRPSVSYTNTLLSRRKFRCDEHVTLKAYKHCSSNSSPRERIQFALGGPLSEAMMTNTSAPQGCILSPALFTLYMADCRSKEDSSLLIKFTDDMSLSSLVHQDQRAGC